MRVRESFAGSRSASLRTTVRYVPSSMLCRELSQLFGRDFRHIGAERVFPVQEGNDGAAVHVASGEAFHEIALRAHHEQAVSVCFLREAGGVLDKG